VERVIKHVNRELKAGRGVFIHAGYNLDGRTPPILACLLIERGYSAKRALDHRRTRGKRNHHVLRERFDGLRD
jgi:hypothetical protein